MAQEEKGTWCNGGGKEVAAARTLVGGGLEVRVEGVPGGREDVRGAREGVGLPDVERAVAAGGGRTRCTTGLMGDRPLRYTNAGHQSSSQ